MRKLTTLNISGINIENMEILGNLEAMEFLYLSGCNLIECPKEIEKLKNLISLDLSNNYLKHFPKKIRALKNLKDLVLHDNQIRKFPDDREKLENLDGLDLRNNQISSVPYALNIDLIFLDNNLLIQDQGPETMHFGHSSVEVLLNTFRCDAIDYIGELLANKTAAPIDMELTRIIYHRQNFEDKIPFRISRVFALRDKIVEKVEKELMRYDLGEDVDRESLCKKIGDQAAAWVFRNISGIRDINHMRMTSFQEGIQDLSPAFYPLPNGLNFVERACVEEFEIKDAPPRIRSFIWDIISAEILNPTQNVKRDTEIEEVTSFVEKLTIRTAEPTAKYVASFREKVMSARSYMDPTESSTAKVNKSKFRERYADMIEQARQLDKMFRQMKEGPLLSATAHAYLGA